MRLLVIQAVVGLSVFTNVLNKLHWLPCGNWCFKADGYEPYLLSPEKGFSALIKQALDLVMELAKMYVDEILFSSKV
jgi:hypothetical protein